MSKQKALNKITPPSDDSFLIDRNQARVVLGNCSYSTILRMEAEGKLTPIRLTGSIKSKVFLRLSQVRAVFGPDQRDEVPPPVPALSPPSKHAQKKPRLIIVDGRQYVEVETDQA